MHHTRTDWVRYFGVKQISSALAYVERESPSGGILRQLAAKPIEVRWGERVRVTQRLDAHEVLGEMPQGPRARLERVAHGHGEVGFIGEL